MSNINRFIRNAGTALVLAGAAFWSTGAQSQVLALSMDRNSGAIISPAHSVSDDAGIAAETPARLRRQVVDYPTSEPPGTVIVDTPNTYLYFVLGGGKAVRYGIGVGREGFTWSGVKSIERMSEWPDWFPPADMLHRQPYLPRFMAGGPGNPLGARAMYHQGRRAADGAGSHRASPAAHLAGNARDIWPLPCVEPLGDALSSSTIDKRGGRYDQEDCSCCRRGGLRRRHRHSRARARSRGCGTRLAGSRSKRSGCADQHAGGRKCGECRRHQHKCKRM
jgi:hypothetical protein